MGHLSLRAAVMGGVCLCAFARIASANTVLTSGTTLTVYGGIGTNPPTPPTSSVRNPTALPYSDSQTTAGVDYHSTDVYTFTDNQFLTTFDEARGGPSYSLAETIGQVFFKVTVDTAYSLSGNYSVHDNDVSIPGHVFYNTYLVDITKNSWYFFQSYDESMHTANATFQLGDSAGDSTNIFYGNLSGTLFANDTYELYHQYFTQASASPNDGGATATGFLKLNIGIQPIGAPPAPTPTPLYGASALLAGLGLFKFLRSRKSSLA